MKPLSAVSGKPSALTILLKASPICMTEGCDHTIEMEKDEDAGHCEACGGHAPPLIRSFGSGAGNPLCNVTR
jgi:hypothetical protein